MKTPESHIQSFTINNNLNWNLVKCKQNQVVKEFHTKIACMEIQIDHFHVTSLPPCWRTITKDSSLASIVSSSNMATMTFFFDSLEIGCKPSIGKRKIVHQFETQLIHFRK